jgi:hypothetical protein
MTRGWSLLTLAGLTAALAAPAAPAQAPQFRWQPGQVLTYKVSQVTTAAETVKEGKLDTTTKLDLVKRWQVVAVDPAGVATLQMSLSSLRMETRSPSGELLLYDSTRPDVSDEQLRSQLTQYVGPALTVMRLDGTGKLVEVQESKFGPASRLESELPFKLVLPPALVLNQSWERPYAIKLEPPHGTGETYQAVQKCTCTGLAGGVATVGVSTSLKTQPEAVADRIPLLPMLHQGVVTFDLANGRLQSVAFKMSQELNEHRGEGSKYVFQNEYREEFVANP